MSKTIKTQALAFAAAVFMTVAVFTGIGAVAGHQARVVADNAVDRDIPVAMEVQTVTIIGHRLHA